MANLLVNVGRALLINRILGQGSEPKHIGWGTGAGTTQVTDTDLFGPSADEARVAGTSSRVTTTVENDTYQVVGLITCQVNPKTITNVALFDGPVGGSMFLKGDFPGVPLNVGDSIQFTIKWQIQ